MPRPPTIPKADYRIITDLLANGRSVIQVAAMYGVSRQAMYRFLARMKATKEA